MALRIWSFLLRSRLRVTITLLLGVIFVGTSTYILYNYEDKPRLEIVSKHVPAALDNLQPYYVVNTPTCKIPDMDPLDPSILNFLKPGFGYPIDCKGQQRLWTYIQGTKILVNVTAVQESGYSTSSIHCCYRTIERVEQPLSDFNINAENFVKYSDKCYTIQLEGTEVDAEFIRVHCISTQIPLLNDVVYRDFFAIAQPNSDRLVIRKLFNWEHKAWKKKKNATKNYRPPPNVVIIGIDNNSRMNTHRHMRQTVNILRKIGAVELLGYTKVAENTFPNTVPFLTGMSMEELSKVCYSSNLDPQDNCPYIWKKFNKADYLTVHAEDTPYLGGFNYLKTGFLRKPTDFYLRPLMLAVMSHMPRFDYYHTDCIGRWMTDEFVFNYILDVIKIATSQKAPVFVHSWLTSLAHYNYNNLQFGDNSTANFIQSLLKISNDNSIFFFMSDHGQRYGPIRETSQGWYEDKLPTQWVYLPGHIAERFPEWYSSLNTNSRRLTSHFDVFQTLLHILRVSDEEHSVEEFQSNELSQVLKGQTLFEAIPENRTCEDAGVTVNYCACSRPEPMSVSDKRVQEAAHAAVQHLAKLVPSDVCAEPTLNRIVTAGYLNFQLKPVYVITLVTDPGEFLFEVNVEVDKVERDSDQQKFVISTDLLRMNKITRSANCVNTPLLERYCYCK